MYISYLYNLYVQKFVYISDLTLIMYNSDMPQSLCWSGYADFFLSFKNTVLGIASQPARRFGFKNQESQRVIIGKPGKARASQQASKLHRVFPA